MATRIDIKIYQREDGVCRAYAWTRQHEGDTEEFPAEFTGEKMRDYAALGDILYDMIRAIEAAQMAEGEAAPESDAPPATPPATLPS